jgi:hypothetical protein
MIDERTVNAISAELSIAYMAAHRTVPESSLQVIAASIADAVPAITADNAHEVFKRAMQVEAIPTVPTLTDAAKNYMAESYPQTGAPALEYKDPRAAWLPKTWVEQLKNMMKAISNLCAAISDAEYMEFCKAHITHKVGDHWEYVNLARAKEFDRPKKAMLQELYCKYWRNLPMAHGFPANAQLNHGLTPPTVPEFREMLRLEAERAAAEF